MPANEYHFITKWRFQAKRQEIVDILNDLDTLSVWWPSVYLDVKELEPGDSQRVGRKVTLYTKGWLPYTLRWQFQVTESNPPEGFTLVANGDFVGRGIWRFEQDGDWVNVIYDWKIAAEKPILKLLSPLMKPIFKQNHLWAMAMGEKSLQLELQRRRAVNQTEKSAIPAPPPPTPSSLPHWLAYVLAGKSGAA